MSSDSEKLRCLKILSEVERYIIEGKRDAEDIFPILQAIIDVGAETDINKLVTGNDIIERIIILTKINKIEWKYKSMGLNCYRLYSELGKLRECEIVFNSGQDGGISWENVGNMRLTVFSDSDSFPASEHKDFVLTHDQKIYFLSILSRLKTKGNQSFLKKFLD